MQVPLVEDHRMIRGMTRMTLHTIHPVIEVIRSHTLLVVSSLFASNVFRCPERLASQYRLASTVLLISR